MIANSIRDRFNVEVNTVSIDIEDEKYINEVNNFNNYDLYLFSPGYIGDSSEALYSYEEAKKITISNYLGFFLISLKFLKILTQQNVQEFDYKFSCRRHG